MVTIRIIIQQIADRSVLVPMALSDRERRDARGPFFMADLHTYCTTVPRAPIVSHVVVATLKYRRRGDMIEVCKILTNKYDSGVNLYLEKQQDNITRGHIA